MFITHPDFNRLNESEVLVQIERWLRALTLSPLTAAFMDDPDITALNDAEYLNQLKQCFLDKLLLNPLRCFMSIYHHDYRYNEHGTAIIHACKEASIPLSNKASVHHDHANISNQLTWEQARIFVATIFDFMQSSNFQRFQYDRQYQEKQNLQKLHDYCEKIHRKYSKVLVIRIDLAYLKSGRHLVNISTVYSHLYQLLKKKDLGSKPFEGLIGYVWAIEQGADKGYHIHCAFYFNGQKHQRDSYIAYHIGILWRTITGNQGTFYNCNKHKKKYRYLGIGMIHRNDDTAVNHSISAVAYLARPEKTDQYLRVRPKKNARTFATGLCHIEGAKPF